MNPRLRPFHLLLASLAGCANEPSRDLPNPAVSNGVDTITLISRTVSNAGSGFAISFRGPLPMDAPPGVDVVFTEDSLGRPVLASLSVLQPSATIYPGTGVQRSTLVWDELVIAPRRGYAQTALTLTEGDLILLKGSTLACGIIADGLFAKLRVLRLDPASHTVTFENLANLNCGYRSLESGLPTR